MDSNDRNNKEEDMEINSCENNFHEESNLAKEMPQYESQDNMNGSTKGKTEENNDGMKLESGKEKKESDNEIKNEIDNYFLKNDASIANSRRDEALILINMAREDINDSPNIQIKDNSLPTNDKKVLLNTNNNNDSNQDNSGKNSDDKLNQNNSNNNNGISSEIKTNIIKLKETGIIPKQIKEPIEDKDFHNLDEFDYVGNGNLNNDNDDINKDLFISKDAVKISTNKPKDNFSSN